MDNNNCDILVLDSKSSVWSTIQKITQNPQQENSFFIIDVGDVVNKYKLWKSVMPRIHPHYAVKCTSHPSILRSLAAIGAGFDVASMGEIDRVLALGVQTDRLIFANTYKRPSHFRHAAAVGINTLTFDSACELQKAKEIHPHAKYVIRIKWDADAEQAHVIFGKKFGCDHATEAPELLMLARRLELDVIGVSFHVGTGVTLGGINVYREAIKAARHVFDVAESMGFKFTLLDIGGGFECDKESIPKFAEVINSALDTYFPNPEIRVISEPGRYFVASAFTLACNIIAMKTVKRINDDTGYTYPHHMYIINDGAYGSFRDHLTKPNKVLIPKVISNNLIRPEKFSSSVWGPTCDSRDRIAADILLPKVDYLDWLVYENLGDYSLPLISPFHEFPSPDLLCVADEKTWKLLKDDKLFKNMFISNIPKVLSRK